MRALAAALAKVTLILALTAASCPTTAPHNTHTSECQGQSVVTLEGVARQPHRRAHQQGQASWETIHFALYTGPQYQTPVSIELIDYDIRGDVRNESRISVTGCYSNARPRLFIGKRVCDLETAACFDVDWKWW